MIIRNILFQFSFILLTTSCMSAPQTQTEKQESQKETNIQATSSNTAETTNNITVTDTTNTISTPEAVVETKSKEEKKAVAKIKPAPDAETIDPSAWKGVNLPLILPAKNGKSLSQKNFDYAAEVGANVVRLSVHADPLDPSSYSFTDKNGDVLSADKSPGITALQQAITWAANDRIKLIVDMHTMPGRTNGEIWNNEKYWNTLTQLWTTIATQLKGNNTVVAFDLMNEPNIIKAFANAGPVQKQIFSGTWKQPKEWANTAKDYEKQIAKLIQAIRSVDANRYVIVEGFGILGNPRNFYALKPIEGFNKIIYSFHMYEPTGLTNVGTKGFEAKGKTTVAFNPATDMNKIDDALAPVIAFQKKYNVPIYVGEFGVTDDAIFSKDASGNTYNGACWMNIIINKMAENHWGWTFWDFWTTGRKPLSNDDPRYVILSAAMKGTTIKDYCK